MNGHENMAAFISGLGALLAALRDAESAMNRTAAPEFSPIRYFASGAPTVRDTALADVNAPELWLSRVFGNFLDPQGTHGQGAHPLKLLLKAVHAARHAFPVVHHAEDCRVRLEQTTDNDRKIDIVLAFPDRVPVGVENKPWSNDQPRQIADYLRYLESLAGNPDNAWMLYFSGSGREPDERALPPEQRRRERCITVPYRALQDGALSIDRWIGLCLQKCQANPVRDFLVYLRNYVQARFPEPTRPSSTEERAMWNFIRNNGRHYVKLAIQVQDFCPRERMYREILKRIARGYEADAAWHVRMPEDGRLRNNNSCMVLQRVGWGLEPDDDTTGLHLGTSSADWGRVYAGFRVQNGVQAEDFWQQLADFLALAANPDDPIHGHFHEPDTGWLWKYVGPDHMNWNVDFIQSWLDDPTPIADNLLSELNSIYNIIGPDGAVPFYLDR